MCISTMVNLHNKGKAKIADLQNCQFENTCNEVTPKHNAFILTRTNIVETHVQALCCETIRDSDLVLV
jgi:hypothetical protein